MEQKDFLLREIERLGQVLSAIRQKIFGGNDRLAISVEKEVDDAKGMLLKEVNLDLDKLLVLNKEEAVDYLNGFKGFNAANTEQLAAYMAQIGFSIASDKSKIYLEKALFLYELTNLKSETYSFEREKNIKAVKDVL
jgi:hypothetical protein